jgi:hypothetical protein
VCSSDLSSFSVEGEINFFRYTTSSQLAYRLDNFPLASLKKQLTEHIDLDPEKGSVNVLMKQIWGQDGYKETANIQLQNTEPKNVDSDTALIIALIGDQNRNFTLELQNTTPDNVNPVTLFDEAISQFQTLVVKAGVSPLLLASGDFKDLIDNNYIEFSPGEFILKEDGQKILNRYVSLLKAHPMLGLRLTGGIAPEIDSSTMKSQLEEVEAKRVTAENEKRRQEWDERNAEYAKKVAEQQKQAQATEEIKEVSIPSELLKKIVLVQPVPVSIDRNMLLELAENRQDVLYQYFNSQLPDISRRVLRTPPQKLSEKYPPGHGVHIDLIAIKPIETQKTP